MKSLHIVVAVLVLALSVPFLPFECLCCDLTGDTGHMGMVDCGPDGMGPNEAKRASDTMVLNRTPAAPAPEHPDCFCATGLTHLLSRTASTPTPLPQSRFEAAALIPAADRPDLSPPALPASPALTPEPHPPASTSL